MGYKFETLVPEKIYGRNSSIASAVFNVLRNAIVTMKLLPGNSLSEAEVAKQMGISRQPVREAFIQLSKIGMLNIIPQKGSYIVKIKERDVENATFIRESIEVAIVQRACSFAKKEHIDQMFTMIARQEEAAAKADQERFLSLDDGFHHTIALSADCLYGWHIVENLKAQMDRVRFLSLPEATPITKIVNQHLRVAQAIKSRDKDAACGAMKIHLREILHSLPRLAAKHQDMFS
ncbi:MAG: GntR family transcriptional regulator [Desulfobacteraceae bacterium]